MRPQYALAFLLLFLLVVVAVLEITALAGAWSLRRELRFDQEIAWLERWEPIRVWEPGRHRTINSRYLERVRDELMAGRLDKAAAAARLARRRFRSQGQTHDPELLLLGVEVFTRAADRLERGGRLSVAADWNDSLFVLAVRADEPRMRNAAIAAFMEGLDQRVRAGEPCAALARVQWAKRGLGGEIPGFSVHTERELEDRCERSRRPARRR
ncbi:MAG: hypothetical protein ABIS67_01180 [Candidatus Eisenbacteria bacterium]